MKVVKTSKDTIRKEFKQLSKKDQEELLKEYNTHFSTDDDSDPSSKEYSPKKDESIQVTSEIIEQDILIEKEIKSGKISDPNAPIDPNTGMPMVAGDSSNGSSGQVPIDPGVDEKDMEPPTEKGI